MVYSYDGTNGQVRTASSEISQDHKLRAAKGVEEQTSTSSACIESAASALHVG